MLSNVVSVTIVPRFIIISKLPYALKLRQIGAESNASNEIHLFPQSAKPFHFTMASSDNFDTPRLLEAQRMAMLSEDDSDDVGDNTLSDRSDSSFSIGNPMVSNHGSYHENGQGSQAWFGEINICNLGIVYLKLRDPIMIVKIQVEIVGASLIATFSEQSITWPPYRIDNFTTLNVRIRQSMPPDELMRDNIPPWSYLGGLESIGYAWDKPMSGDKSVLVEFFQGNEWIQHKIALDSLAKFETISFFRNLPDLSKNLSEGYLDKYEPLTDTWSAVYCVLLPNVLYMFTSDNKKDLVGIINLSRPHEGDIQLAKVCKHLKNTWTDLTENIGTTMDLLGLNFTGNNYKYIFIFILVFPLI